MQPFGTSETWVSFPPGAGTCAISTSLYQTISSRMFRGLFSVFSTYFPSLSTVSMRKSKVGPQSSLLAPAGLRLLMKTSSLPSVCGIGRPTSGM